MHKKSSLFFDNFTFQYKSQKQPTLYEISLRIKPGEKILIVGPSGSGKSTLAHCINGLIPHAFPGKTSGVFELFDEEVIPKGIFAVSKLVGTVLQDTDGQFVGLSAGEDIAFALENDCIVQELMKERVQAVAKIVGIDHQLHKAPHNLSGGQKQRVSVAGVLVDNVDILLFDEPLANLDPKSGVHAIDLIDQLHRETKKTIIIIEHRLEDVLYRSVDRILVINEGRIIADESPNELLAGELLQEIGIREPLYLTALRYAGVNITSAICPEHIDKVRLDEDTYYDRDPGACEHRSSKDKEQAAKQDMTPAEQLRAWDFSLPPAQALEPGKPLLEAKNISFFYPSDLEERLVVNDISFHLDEGEAVSLVGSNGAGKSTLAKLICGFEAPQKGRLLYQGMDMATDSISERAERIGYIMQNPNQMISLPMIYDEVALGLRVRGVKEAEIKDKVEDTLRVCGLYPFRKWPINALSFGQKKRLTIAAILVLRPQILILDEPTAGQDFFHYTQFMEFLRQLNQQMGLCMLMITHDMHLMLEYTSRAIVISDAKKLADDTPANVLTDDSLIEAASLKCTSLYDLAVRSKIDDPRGFVQRFIHYDREVRSRE